MSTLARVSMLLIVVLLISGCDEIAPLVNDINSTATEEPSLQESLLGEYVLVDGFFVLEGDVIPGGGVIPATGPHGFLKLIITPEEIIRIHFADGNASTHQTTYELVEDEFFTFLHMHATDDEEAITWHLRWEKEHLVMTSVEGDIFFVWMPLSRNETEATPLLNINISTAQ